jgi:NADH-quinone oxidoreductase subunit E
MFAKEILEECDGLVGMYPDPRSALLPLLHLIQREQGWISAEAQSWTADRLDLAPIMVQGVVSFYTMFNQNPVGRHHIQLCKTLSCTLRGTAKIRDHIRNRLGIGPGETSADGRFTLTEVECLGACGTAPAMMIGEDYSEELSVEKLDEILDLLLSAGEA